MRDRIDFGLPQLFHFVCFSCSSVTKSLAAALVLILFATILPAQTQTPAQTPYLFASTPVSQTRDGIVTVLRDPHSGALTLLPAPTSTFHSPCIPEAMEPQGQFLFGVCGDGLAMYTFDATSGAVQEIANSPYSISTGTGLFPFLVAPESTGQFVYVLKFTEPTPGAVTYRLDKFQIDRTTPQLIPLSTQVLPLGSSMVGATADPNGHGIAVVTVETDPITSATKPVGFFITFDPTTGAETVPSAGTVVPGTTPTAFALSSQGKYFALGSTTEGFNLAPISFTTLFILSTNAFTPTGTPLSIQSPGAGPLTTQPLYLNFDPLGGLLYIQYANSQQPPQGASPFEVYQVPGLTHVDTLPFEQSNVAFSGIADPDATYRYEPISGTPPQGLAVWVIDPATGLPEQPASLTKPFFASLDLNPVFANYVSSGSGQNLSGPFLSQSAQSLLFGPTTTGKSSPAQTVTLTSAGGQPVSFTSISISGANASDFALSGSCVTTALLQPQTSCPLTVIYSPSNVGNSSAVVTITGNSPTSPQTISLLGSAVAPPVPAPVASLSTANPFSLPGTTTQGTSGTPQTISVSNTGNAPLHISSVTLGGFNSADYGLGASTCSGASVAPNSSCTVAFTFVPLGSGLRTATITITDDAANSPQVLSIIGTAVPAVNFNAASGGSTSISLSAGQTAQYNLTATPGAGFNGTLSFNCSGVPFGATCSAPSVAVSNGVATPFTVTVTTASSAFVPIRFSPPMVFGPRSLVTFAAALLALTALFYLAQVRFKLLRPVQLAVCAPLLALLISSGLGCGSGTSTQSQPQPQTQAAAIPAITPNGGTFSSTYPSVTITDTTPGATIHFTTDGSTPTASSANYAAPIALTAPGTVQAMATASGFTPSAVASASFRIQAAPGNYTITVTPTAVANGSSVKLAINPISLSLSVK